MAETSIRGPRGRTGGAGAAIEKFKDAVFVRNDIEFYFGDDGDVSLSYDSTNGHFLLDGFSTVISDADPLLSDALFLESDTNSATAYFLKISSGS